MISRYPLFTGVFLILIGLAVLFRPYYDLDIYFFRSYGLFLIGLLGLFKGLSASPRRGIYLPFFITLVGIYYILGNFGFYDIERGLTVSVFIIFLGISFYPLYLSVNRKWNYLLYGNLVILTGLIFLAYYLDFVPPHIFRALVNDYWPVAIIIIGLAYLINAFKQNRKHSVSGSAN